MSILYGIRNYLSLFGLPGVFLAAKSRVSRGAAQVKTFVPGLRHPIFLRFGTSDVTLLRSIFLDGEYDWKLLKMPQVIVDAGANIGLTSILFANRYPKARIIAIEPESSNYALLRKNAALYPQVETMQAALWKEETTLRITNSSGEHWAFRTEEKRVGDPGSESNVTVQATTVERLMECYAIEFIDILKIDIEGAEKEVFGNCKGWIDRVGVVMIELHDRLSESSSEMIRRATADFTFCWARGETVVLGRQGYGGPTYSGEEFFRAERSELGAKLPFRVSVESS